jgi:hypothetical protein
LVLSEQPLQLCQRLPTSNLHESMKTNRDGGYELVEPPTDAVYVGAEVNAEDPFPLAYQCPHCDQFFPHAAPRARHVELHHPQA